MMLPILDSVSSNVKYFGLAKSYIDAMTIGIRIKGARLAAQFTSQAGFAVACGISRQYMNNLEKDRVQKPDASVMARIAEVANVDDHWLITGEGTPERRRALSEDETELLKAYRALSQQQRIALLNFAKATT